MWLLSIIALLSSVTTSSSVVVAHDVVSDDDFVVPGTVDDANDSFRTEPTTIFSHFIHLVSSKQNTHYSISNIPENKWSPLSLKW